MRLVLICFVISLAAAEDHHETLDDNHDFENVVKNPKLLKQHLDCYLHRGPCTDVMLSYRKYISDVIAEACGRCNPPQKHMVRVCLEGLARYNPAGFEEYRQMYDPEDKYLHLLRAAVAEY